MHGCTFSHLVSASRTTRNGFPNLSFYPIPTPSARALNTQAYPTAFNETNTTTSKPSYPGNSLKDPGKVCFIEDCAQYPNATKTVDQYGGSNGYVSEADLEHICVLWNSSCTGNINSARNEFFANNIADTLISNECFLEQPTDPSQPNRLEGCNKIEPAQRLLRFGQAKNWMRSPQCLSNAAVWSSSHPVLAANSNSFPRKDPGAGSCCAKCDISVKDVDIYYWPEVDVDTSCLSIIGNGSNPIDYGATTTSQEYAYIGRSSSSVAYSTYWGCKGPDSSITTTAYLTTINSITFKASSYNPWSPPLCPENPSQSIAPIASSTAGGEYASIRARAHSLVVQPTITQKNGLPMSTVVLGSFTFTSPSIYANFHQITGDDGCGKPVYVSETMLTFSPGELSTIAGPLTDCNIDYCSFSTRAYNFRDLPCPPQSVMEENWYKPQPGEPYRPLIAMPKQIQKLRAYYSRCTDNFFTGFDPPRTLAPAAALAPTTTTSDPEVFTTVPKPSPTPDAGAKKTANSEPPMITPADRPVVGEPQKPDNQASDANHELSHPQSKAQESKPSKDHPAQPGPDPVEISGGHKYGNNADAVPGEENNPTLPLIPVPTIAAGLHGGSNQNTDPIVHDTPPPGGNADPAVGEPAKSHNEGKPDDAQQTHNADRTLGDPGAKHPSKLDASTGTTGDPENHNPSKPSPSVKTKENSAKDNPNKPNQSAEAEGGPRIGISNTANQPAKVMANPETQNPRASDWSAQSKDRFSKEDSSIIHPSTKGTHEPGLETPKELVPLAKITGEPKKDDPSKPSPSLETEGETRKSNPKNPDQSATGVVDSGKKDPSNPNPLIGHPTNESVSELDESADIMTDSEKVKEYTSELIQLLEPTGNPGKETSSQFDSLLETIRGPEQKNASLSNLSNATSIEPETGMDPVQGDEPGKPHGSPQAENERPGTYEDHVPQSDEGQPNGLPQLIDEMYGIDPFYITPDQISRIKHALSQPAHLPPGSAENQYGAPKTDGLPGLVEQFGQRPQTKTISASQLSQLQNLQSSSISGPAITAAPTPASRTTFPSGPLKVNMNGTLGTPSASTNATETGAASNLDGEFTTPASGNKIIQSNSSSVNKYDTSMASEVQVFSSKAWVVLGIAIVLWMG